MISNEYAVKLCLEHKVKTGNKVVKKELIISLIEEIYFVKFIINPEQDDVEPGVILGRSFLQEAAKEALAIRASQKFALLEEERPVIETMAYHDKYKKILDDIWKDKVELDRKIVKEEEEAVQKIKGEALKEKDDLEAFIFPIRLEGKVNENVLADTGSDINTIPYRIYETLGRKEMKKVDKGRSYRETHRFSLSGIAPAAIIDRQLPFEYTITSRSTNVVVMAQHVQNINHSAFGSMFEREKLSGNNFNDWFRQLKLVLRVEKKMYVIEQPLLAAHAADSAANELKSMFEKQAAVERFDLIQTFYACKQEEGKPVAAYVLQMKGYVDQLEHLGYMLPQDLIVGLILNGFTKDFARFVRNYKLHNMGKTISELHAMLIEYEKGLPKKDETPQVMMIKGGKIQKSKKKSLKDKGKGKANGKGNDKQVYIPKPKNPKPSAKEHLAKDDTCHHCK
nr:hypothetical protein [Tanacetum cinerariifolium]